MREQKRVFNKLFKEEKTELSAQKVELALIDELQKQNDKFLKVLKSADNSWRDYQDYLTSADKPFKKMIADYKQLSDWYSKMSSEASKAERAARDLGVDIPFLSVLKRNINIANEILSTIASFDDPNTFQ